jgi:hypothetical protein
MKRRRAPRSVLRDAFASTGIVAPSLAAFVTALGLSQITPMVRAATNPPPPVIKPLPMLAEPAAYPMKYAISRTMKFAGPIKFGDWAWNETKAPLTGPVLVTVDIASETLSVFRGGHQIGMTRMIYGDDDKPTPIGTFPITQKSEKHRSASRCTGPTKFSRFTQPTAASASPMALPNGFLASYRWATGSSSQKRSRSRTVMSFQPSDH